MLHYSLHLKLHFSEHNLKALLHIKMYLEKIYPFTFPQSYIYLPLLNCIAVCLYILYYVNTPLIEAEQQLFL